MVLPGGVGRGRVEFYHRCNMMLTPGGARPRRVDSAARQAHGGRVSLLLPQTRVGTVQSATPVSIHGDRYVDLAIALEGTAGPPVVGRVGAADCPGSLMQGERVSVRFTMGVMVRVAREVG